MDGVKGDRAAKQLHEDPMYNLDGIINTMETLKKETTAIFERPPPKPKAEEKPADAEMKDEKAPEGGEKPAGDAPAEGEKKEGDAEMNNEEAKAE